jgi:hypothetical protein
VHRIVIRKDSFHIYSQFAPSLFCGLSLCDLEIVIARMQRNQQFELFHSAACGMGGDYGMIRRGCRKRERAAALVTL